MNVYNDNWLGKQLKVISSNDETLVGREGLVIDETRNTLTVREQNKSIKIGKASIKFTIDDSNIIIDGANVGQRPENRTHKKYRIA